MKLLINPEKEVTNVLIVEDSDTAREAILEQVKEEFPFTKVYAPKNLFDEDIRLLITHSHFSHILLDPSLARWGTHPEFGEWGENLIPLIKQVSPATEIIAIGAELEENERMITKGAHSGIEKKHFLSASFTRQFLQ